MAPTKKTADPKPKAASKDETKDRNRVVKRPARGFHRFRNGMLNVTPKGGEKELYDRASWSNAMEFELLIVRSYSVKRNQDSPLLRLPAELRRQIWEYVFGGTIIRKMSYTKDGRHRNQLTPAITDGPYGLGLLRACRQIYSETAILPYSLNTFDFWNYESIKRDLKSLRPFQRASITRIQFANVNCWGLISHLTDDQLATARLDLPPTLEHIHVVLHQHAIWSGTTLEASIKGTQDQLEILLQGTQIQSTIEVKQSRWEDYRKTWIPSKAD